MDNERTGKRRIAVAMLGARRHYAVPEALHAAGLLHTFFTDFHTSIPIHRGGTGLPALDRALGRRAPGIPPELVRRFPLFGMRRALAARLPQSPSTRYRRYLNSNREFCRLVLQHWPADADTFYTFNSAGLEILAEAKRRGYVCVVDQITAPWAVEEPLVQEERERWPGWGSRGVDRSSWQPLAEREQKEWGLADVIICGSAFVRDGIAQLGGPGGKCQVIPYGVRDDLIQHAPRRRHDGPLRVLFVGNDPLRKGLPYVLEAADRVPPETATFRAVGAFLVPRSSRIEIRNAVPRTRIGEEYEWADVLVAPSISEGSANVCYEALARGIPVITTPNAGSVVRDGKDGFLVPIRSGQAIAERAATIARDAGLWQRLSDSARERASQFTWRAYASRLSKAICGTPS